MKSRRGQIKRAAFFCALLVGVALLGAIRGSRAGGEIAWARNYEAALGTARRTERPIMINFHAPDAAWCGKMDSETFTDPKVVDLLRRFVCVRAERDVDGALVSRYQVHTFPETVFLDSKAATKLRCSGFIRPAPFITILQSMLAAH